MPYFVFEISTAKDLQAIAEFDSYRDARALARRLRAQAPDDGQQGAQFKLVHAADANSGARLLSEKREPRPSGEDA